MEPTMCTNVSEEAIASLEMVEKAALDVLRDPYQWKWITIYLHNSVQCFMILALQGTDGLAPQRDKVAAKWLEAYRNGTEFPKERLDGFTSLYAKLKHGMPTRAVCGKVFSATNDHDWSVRMINELRNGFIHFVPQDLTVVVAGYPGICLACLDIIDFVVHDCRGVRWSELASEIRAETALRNVRDRLEMIRKVYEVHSGDEVER